MSAEGFPLTGGPTGGEPFVDASGRPYVAEVVADGCPRACGYYQAYYCGSETEAPVFLRACALPVTPPFYFYIDQCYYVPADASILGEAAGTVYGEFLVMSDCTCNVYVQALNCADGTPADLWFASPPPNVPFYFSYEGACYVIDVRSSTSMLTPDNVVAYEEVGQTEGCACCQGQPVATKAIVAGSGANPANCEACMAYLDENGSAGCSANGCPNMDGVYALIRGGYYPDEPYTYYYNCGGCIGGANTGYLEVSVGATAGDSPGTYYVSASANTYCGGGTGIAGPFTCEELAAGVEIPLTDENAPHITPCFDDWTGATITAFFDIS